MLKRPSSRRKTSQGEIRLNLVPMMDALVTLIAFLLFTMSFLAFVSLETPTPILSEKSALEELNQKPLQLTLTIQKNEVEIWSPFDLIRPIKIKATEEGYPTEEVHRSLLEIKGKFPTEKKIVFMPSAEVSYDALVSLMDSARNIEKTDSPIFAKNESGVDQQVTQLFPEIIYGNLLGGQE